MRFTAIQYDRAIEALRSAKQQLEPDGHYCACCGDGGHQAFECGHNPLVAIALCKAIADGAENLHQTLHSLAGYESYMGEVVGPRKVVLPAKE